MTEAGNDISRRSPEKEAWSFQELVDLYKQDVYRTALRLTQNHEDALDISQETFLRVFRQFHKWTPEGSFSPWVYRITVNLCMDLLRKRARRRKIRLTRATSISTANLGASGNPERTAQMRELNERIEDALSSLSPRQKAVFVLRHYQGLSLNEIATVLRCSEGTVKMHLFRATGRLRDKLAKEIE